MTIVIDTAYIILGITGVGTLFTILIGYIIRESLSNQKALSASMEEIKVLQSLNNTQSAEIKKDIHALTINIKELKDANSELTRSTNELMREVAVLKEWRKFMESINSHANA